MKPTLLLLLWLGCCPKVFGADNHSNIQQDSLPAVKDSLVALDRIDSAAKDAMLLPASKTVKLPIGIAAPSNTGANIITGNINKYVAGFISDYYSDNTKHLIAIQSKSEPYFSTIKKVFRQYGVPEELKYLAVIESGLNTNAVSRMGAVGAWQFMSGTARLFGLTVRRHHDERRDLYKSTTAAAKYLSQLHDMLDNWLLVVAAYNCGPGGVLRAIKESGSTNFFELQNYLPAESKGHVMKFLATAYILDRFSDFFGLDMSGNTSDLATNITATDGLTADNLSVLPVSGKYSLPVIAKYLSMDINELNRLNPGFDKLVSGTTNSYQLRLPPEKMELFKANKNTILNESVQLMMDNNRLLASYLPAADSSTADAAAASGNTPPHRKYASRIVRHKTQVTHKK